MIDRKYNFQNFASFLVERGVDEYASHSHNQYERRGVQTGPKKSRKKSRADRVFSRDVV
jgi:hypothetical protein